MSLSNLKHYLYLYPQLRECTVQEFAKSTKPLHKNKNMSFENRFKSLGYLKPKII